MHILYIVDDLTFQAEAVKVAKNIEEKSSYNYYIWYRIKNFDYDKVAKFRDNIKNSILILSERQDIALKLGYDGVHLNNKRYKYPVGKELIVGYSAHSVEEIYSIKADYYTLSPIFESKNGSKLIDLDNVKFDSKKVFALGGVNFENYNILNKHLFVGPAGIRLALNPT